MTLARKKPAAVAVHMVWLLGIWGAVTIGIPLSAQEDAAKDDSSTEPLVAAVSQLGAETFEERSAAMTRLLDAGDAAIAPLVAELDKPGTKARMRVLAVIGQLAVRYEGDTRKAAEAALETLSRSTDDEIARIASRAFGFLGERAEQRALEQLRAAGAHVKTEVVPGTGEAIGLIIDERWSGDVSSLAPLRRLKDLNLLVFSGAAVKDELFEMTGDLPFVRALVVHRAGITNAAVKSISKMSGLHRLNLMYCDVDDDCIDDLIALASDENEGRLRELRLLGTAVSPEGAARFHEATGIEVDRRAGGFLGIYFNTGPGACTIVRVVRGSGASNAGIETGDVIRSCAGHEISTASSFFGVLDDYGPGDKVPVTIEREGEQLDLQVELGFFPAFDDERR